jgi:hypothetical protein
MKKLVLIGHVEDCIELVVGHNYCLLVRMLGGTLISMLG